MTVKIFLFDFIEDLMNVLEILNEIPAICLEFLNVNILVLDLSSYSRMVTRS